MWRRRRWRYQLRRETRNDSCLPLHLSLWVSLVAPPSIKIHKFSHKLNSTIRIIIKAYVYVNDIYIYIYIVGYIDNGDLDLFVIDG